MPPLYVRIQNNHRKYYIMYVFYSVSMQKLYPGQITVRMAVSTSDITSFVHISPYRRRA